MDQTIKTFLDAGAEIVAGDVLYKREVVALCRHGQTILTPEGEQALAALARKAAVQDVEVKAFTPAPVVAPEAQPPVEAKPVRAARQVKAKGLTPPEPPAIPAGVLPAGAPAETDLDTLLGQS